MKKLIPLLFVLLIAGCQKEDCYKFSVTSTVTRVPDNSSYPINSFSTFFQCGITEKEAKKVSKFYNSTTSESVSGATYTTTSSCVYTRE